METPIPILSFWHIYLVCGSLAEKAYSLAREFLEIKTLNKSQIL